MSVSVSVSVPIRVRWIEMTGCRWCVAVRHGGVVIFWIIPRRRDSLGKERSKKRETSFVTVIWMNSPDVFPVFSLAVFLLQPLRCLSMPPDARHYQYILALILRFTPSETSFDNGFCDRRVMNSWYLSFLLFKLMCGWMNPPVAFG